MEPELLARIRSVAAALLRDHPVLCAYVYGSRVAGTPTPASDLDVGYYLVGHRRGARLSIHEEMSLAARLSKAIGLTVDLRNLGEAPLELKGRVLEEGARIYSSDDVERVGLERDLLGRYHDYKDIFREMHEIRLRRIAERGL